MIGRHDPGRRIGARLARFGLAAVAALGLVAAPLAVPGSAARAQARPCYPGIIPGNPYLQWCSMPDRTPRVRGAAPDQTAIIACRGIPGCLSWYVNNPH